MFCKKCGNELKQGAEFCEKCGAQIEKAEQKIEKSKPRKEKHYAVIIVMVILILILIIGILGIGYYFLLQRKEGNAKKVFHNVAMENNALLEKEIIAGEGNLENGHQNSEEQNEQKIETKISDITNYVTKNTEVVDKYYNKITIPTGFKVLIGEASTVTEGIVIQDERGNEFVWIPVGMMG